GIITRFCFFLKRETLDNGHRTSDKRIDSNITFFILSGGMDVERKVLIFGDIGIDDTMAILYGYFNNEIDIVGIVADYGNVTRDKAVANVQYMSSLLSSQEVEKVAIIGGAEMPMTGEVPQYFPEIHGEYGLGPIIPPAHFQEGDVLENLFEVVTIIDEIGRASCRARSKRWCTSR